MQVAHIDINLIREAFQFRILLEKEAVANFTRTASDDAIAAMLKDHRDIANAAEMGSSPELDERAQAVDWGMHDAFIDSLGNSIISNAYRVNSIKMRLINQERFRIAGHVKSVMKEHLVILEAVERRSVDEAVDRLTAHIRNARDRALTV